MSRLSLSVAKRLVVAKSGVSAAVGARLGPGLGVAVPGGRLDVELGLSEGPDAEHALLGLSTWGLQSRRDTM